MTIYDVISPMSHPGLIYLIKSVSVSIIGIAATIWVYCAYKRILRASQRHEFREELSSVRKQLLDRVAFRAIFYSLAYLNTFAWPLINRLLSDKFVNAIQASRESDEPFPTGLFAFNVISFIMYPSQGLWNYLIFTSHHKRELRQKYPDEKWWQLAMRVWRGEGLRRTGRSSMSELQHLSVYGKPSDTSQNSRGLTVQDIRKAAEASDCNMQQANRM